MIYSYVCKTCGMDSEVTRPIGRAPKTTRCRSCGGRTTRIYSAPSIRFKGSGFHKTDYGPGGPKDSET